MHPRFVAVGTTSGAVALFRVPATGPDAAGDVQAALDANHAGRDAAAVLGDGKSGERAVGEHRMHACVAIDEQVG